MNKQCPVCEKSFKTKDSRQQSCSKVCADKRRATNAWKSNRLSLPLSPLVSRPTMVLPLPEELPAPYAKRVHDMWAALVGDEPTRIA